MVMKRKTTTRIVKDADAAAAGGKHSKIEMEKDVEEEEVEEQTMDAEDEEEVQESQEESQEEKLARIEKETYAARKKELKAMAVDRVKALLVSNGLEMEHTKKEDMINAMLAHEAKAREAVRAKQARIREVIVKKKNELEALPMTELIKMCTALGIEKVRARQDRVRLILENWQKEDGVEKAIEQMEREERLKQLQIAREERLNQLQGMEIEHLRMLCESNDVDPFVKEVIADRVAKAEKLAGRFARPILEKKEEVVDKSQSADLVDALIANESTRKATQKKQMEQEESTKAKMTELRGTSVEDLKKLLAKHGASAEGKKDALVAAAYAIFLQEEAVNSRKSELKAMSLLDLKEFASEKDLECGHSKEKLIAAILEYEAKRREEAKAFDAKAEEVVAELKEELESKTNAELKDLCYAKSLAPGLSKEGKVERLLEQARSDGEIDTRVSVKLFEKRKEQLISIERSELLALCEKFDADPCVKEVLIERLLAFEEEHGVVAEPPKKKSRKA